MGSDDFPFASTDFADVCAQVRRNILTAAFKAGANGAHLAPSLSCVEILVAIQQKCMHAPGKLILSKGHAGLALYATMFAFGKLKSSDFDSFESNGGLFPGQPSKSEIPGMEYSSGSLGMLLSYTCGRALVSNERFFVVLGDGETNEGSVWESAMFAGSRHMKNLTVVVDFNRMQADGDARDILSYDMWNMWSAAGWDVVECDGHSVPSVLSAFDAQGDRPLAVLAKTVKGKGVSFMENAKAWHHARLSPAQYESAMHEVGAEDGV